MPPEMIADFLQLWRGGQYVCGWALGPAMDAIQREIDLANASGQVAAKGND